MELVKFYEIKVVLFSSGLVFLNETCFLMLSGVTVLELTYAYFIYFDLQQNFDQKDFFFLGFFISVSWSDTLVSV